MIFCRFQVSGYLIGPYSWRIFTRNLQELSYWAWVRLLSSCLLFPNTLSNDVIQCQISTSAHGALVIFSAMQLFGLWLLVTSRVSRASCVATLSKWRIRDGSAVFSRSSKWPLTKSCDVSSPFYVTVNVFTPSEGWLQIPQAFIYFGLNNVCCFFVNTFTKSFTLN